MSAPGGVRDHQPGPAAAGRGAQHHRAHHRPEPHQLQHQLLQGRVLRDGDRHQPDNHARHRHFVCQCKSIWMFLYTCLI